MCQEDELLALVPSSIAQQKEATLSIRRRLLLLAVLMVREGDQPASGYTTITAFFFFLISSSSSFLGLTFVPISLSHLRNAPGPGLLPDHQSLFAPLFLSGDSDHQDYDCSSQ